MSASDEVRRALVDGWIQLAELDFSLAEELLEGGARHPLAIAFHSQQAAEKYLKALLVERQLEFPKTHDLGRLIQLAGRADPEVLRALKRG
jgi:HEPN domain-containing protein